MIWLKKRPVQLVVAAVLSLLLLYRLYYTAPIPAMLVEPRDYQPVLQLGGEVIPNQNHSLSSPLSAAVTDILVSERASVKKGDVLLIMDDGSARLQAEQARKLLTQAQLQYDQASSLDFQQAQHSFLEAQQRQQQADLALQRSLQLMAAGAISQLELEKAQNEANLAREAENYARVRLESYSPGGSNLALLANAVEQRKIAVAQAELDLAKYRIMAPQDGTVLDIAISTGEQAQPGQEIIRMSSGTNAKVKLQPDQQYASIISTGMAASVWIPADPQKTYPGQVSKVAALADPGQGTLEVEVTLQDASGLPAGTLVTVQLTSANITSAYIIDDGWLSSRDGQPGVWVVDNSGKAQFRAIVLGQRGALGTVVREGLHSGDMILQPLDLKPGQRVKAQLQTTEQKV